MKRLLSGFILLCIAPIGFSKSFGVVGAIFPIKEMSFLELIQLRLNTLTENHALEAIETEWQSRAERLANRPTPVGLPRVTENRTYHYDPSVTLTNDILNENGQVLYAKGTRVNGLETRPDYQPCWLFLNFDDLAQTRWIKHALKQCAKPKVILTGGAIKDAEQTLNTVIYFDQGGALSHRFQLKGLPASVMREGNRLRVTEVFIKESGDAI